MGFYTAIPKVRAVDFLDQAGDPATLGRMQRNGDLVKAYDGTIAAKLGFQTCAVAGSNVTVANATMADITGMSFTVGASETWHFLIAASYQSTTDEDAKWDFSGPVGASIVWTNIAFSSSLGFSAGGNIAIDADLTTGGAGAIDLGIWMSGKITNGVNAGTIQLRGAQAAEVDADVLTVYIGSHGLAWRAT